MPQIPPHQPQPLPEDVAFLRYQQTGDARELGKVVDDTAAELLKEARHLVSDLNAAEDL